MRHFNNIKIAVLSVVFTLIFAFTNAQNHPYINQHKDVVIKLSKEYGIPSSVIFGIAALESGWGTSKNSKTLNNHFGIVGKNAINSSIYRSFSSVYEGYEAFCKILSGKKYYSQLKDNPDHSAWINAMAKAGYSTQPETWKTRVNAIIAKFKLYNLDD